MSRRDPLKLKKNVNAPRDESDSDYEPSSEPSAKRRKIKRSKSTKLKINGTEQKSNSTLQLSNASRSGHKRKRGGELPINEKSENNRQGFQSHQTQGDDSFELRKKFIEATCRRNKKKLKKIQENSVEQKSNSIVQSSSTSILGHKRKLGRELPLNNQSDDNQQEDRHDQIEESESFEKLRKILFSALRARRTKKINSIWNDAKNATFRSWFCGMTVNQKNVEVPPISLSELTKNFKVALKSMKSYVINEMLNKNALLNQYFNGKSINYHGQEIPEIAPKKLVKNFKMVLISCDQKFIDEIWEKNELLKDAIRKCDINEAQEVLYAVIVYKSRINSFMKGYLNWVEDIQVIQGVLKKLSSKCQKSKLNSERINLLKARLKEVLNKRLEKLNKEEDELKKKNILNLQDRSSPITSEQGNGFVTNLTDSDIATETDNEPDDLSNLNLDCQSSSSISLQFFETSPDKNEPEISARWALAELQNPIQEVNSSLSITHEQSEDNNQKSEKSNEKEALPTNTESTSDVYSRSEAICPEIVANQSDVLERQVPFAPTSHHEDEYEMLSDEPTLSEASSPFDKLLREFKENLLFIKDKDMNGIQLFWLQNPILLDWFHGKSMIFQGQDVPLIPIDDLIENFIIVLKSQCSLIIEEIWRKNQRLQDSIDKLDIERAKEILQVVMDNCCFTSFCKKYVNFLNNSEVIEQTLEEIKQCHSNKSSYDLKILILERRLKDLQAAPANYEDKMSPANAGSEASVIQSYTESLNVPSITENEGAEPENGFWSDAEIEKILRELDFNCLPASEETPLNLINQGVFGQEKESESTNPIPLSNRQHPKLLCNEILELEDENTNSEGPRSNPSENADSSEVLEDNSIASRSGSKRRRVSRTTSTSAEAVKRRKQIKQVDPPPNLSTTFTKILNKFVDALYQWRRKTKKLDIKTIWETNKTLREWLFSNEVQWEGRSLIIPFDYLIYIFQRLLRSGFGKVTQDMWSKNKFLREHFSGKQIHYHDEDIPEISFIQLVRNLESVFQSRCGEVIKAMWFEDELLRHHYRGEPIKYKDQDIPAISQDELIDNFRIILKSQCQVVINSMWENNIELQEAIRQLEVSNDVAKASEILDKVLSSVGNCISSFIEKYATWLNNIEIFKISLNRIKATKKDSPYRSSRIKFLEKRILNYQKDGTENIIEGQQQIRDNEPSRVNLRSESTSRTVPKTTSTRIIKKRKPIKRVDPPPNLSTTFTKILNKFVDALYRCRRKTKKLDIKTIWETNKTLREWLFSNEVQWEGRSLIIPFDYLIYIFQRLLRSGFVKVTQDMWFKNKFLREYFSGKQIHYHGKDIPEISFKEVVRNLKSVFYSRCSGVITNMWFKNELLRHHYRGEPIKYKNQDIPAISQDKLIKNFLTILKCYNRNIVESMWDENTLLQEAIRQLEISDVAKASEILDKVLSSEVDSINPFMKKYASWLNNIQVFEKTWERIKADKDSSVKNKKIKFLEECILSCPKNRVDNTTEKDNPGGDTSTDGSMILNVDFDFNQLLGESNNEERFSLSLNGDDDDSNKFDDFIGDLSVESLNAPLSSGIGIDNTNSTLYSPLTLFNHSYTQKNNNEKPIEGRNEQENRNPAQNNNEPEVTSANDLLALF